MKRLFITLTIVIMAIGAQAQTTWNVRVGVGMIDGYDTNGGPSLAVQSNIPISKGKKWTFSPSVIAVTNADDGLFYAPMSFGYKVVMANRMLFFPKIGPAIGIDFDGDGFIGPAIELAFEIKHFVIALDYTVSAERDVRYDYYSVDEYNTESLSITLGYKF